MGKYPLLEKFMANQAGVKETFPGSKMYMASGYQDMTRDDIIAMLNKPVVGIGNHTKWDIIKMMQGQGGYGVTIDPWGMKDFNTYDEWKNWFITQHPNNDILASYQTKGANMATQPTATLPTMNQPAISQPTTLQPTTSQLEGVTTTLPTINQPAINNTNYQFGQLKEDSYRLPQWGGNTEYSSWLKNWKKQNNIKF